MIKKFSIGLLAVIYLAVSSGLAINTHYCMGKIASASIYHNENEKCGKCGMKSGTDGCCKDELKIMKLNDSHQLIDNEINISVPVALSNTNYSNFDSDITANQLPAQVHNNSPPDLGSPSLNILHCVFRI